MMQLIKLTSHSENYNQLCKYLSHLFKFNLQAMNYFSSKFMKTILMREFSSKLIS